MNQFIKTIRRSLDKEEAFKDLRAMLGRRTGHQDNQKAMVDYVNSLRTKRDELNSDFYLKNDIEAFKALVASSAAFENANKAFEHACLMTGGGQREVGSAEGAKIVLNCIQSFRDSLAKRISELNDDERKRLAAAGLESDGREHPAISDLKVFLSRLADAICDLKESTGGNPRTNHYVVSLLEV